MQPNTVMRENEMHNKRAPLSVVLYSIKSNFPVISIHVPVAMFHSCIFLHDVIVKQNPFCLCSCLAC